MSAPEGEPMCDVLIVDDDEEMSSVMAAAIMLEGFDTRCIEDGQRALDVLCDGLRPRLILLDLGLPGISGFDVALRMRDDPHLAGIPIVVSTGQRLPSSAAAAIGARELLRKPARLAEMISVVRRYVSPS